MSTPPQAIFPTPAAADDIDGRRAAIATDVVAPLAHLGYLRLSGADVDGFLQGQLSNDLRELKAGRTQLSSWNSAKGRVLALFTAWRDGDAVWLETSRSLIDPVTKRLRMFVLRSKVSIEDCSATHAAFGVAGDGAAGHLAALGLPVPVAAGELAVHQGVQIVGRPGTRPRFTLHGPAEALQPLWQALSGRCRPVSSGAWELLDVLAGLPSVVPATQDHFVAQMLNLDVLDGISFNKGCYTGQEVIARLHYLGQLKRRMFLLYTPQADEVPPGTAIHLASGDTQAVGEVVAAQRHPTKGIALLAVLQLPHAASTDLRLGTPDGTALEQPIALIPG